MPIIFGIYLNKGRKFMNKNGFTLAEVLITVGIIGIVSVITIPNIASNIRANKLQSQFNKTYADLNRAARAFYQDNDMTFREYQDSLYATNPTYSTNVLQKFMSYFNGYKDLKMFPHTYDETYGITNRNVIGEERSVWYCDRSNVFVDLVGRTYSMDDMLSPESAGSPKLCVDINGKDSPNKWGVDRFIFSFTNTNSVIPYSGITANNPGVIQTNESLIVLFCKSTTSNSSHTCAYFAQKNKNPEGKGDYWHDFLRGK
jgi:prepilin-type N-terminal cleavage/methylation domain-containing protein